MCAMAKEGTGWLNCQCYKELPSADCLCCQWFRWKDQLTTDLPVLNISSCVLPSWPHDYFLQYSSWFSTPLTGFSSFFNIVKASKSFRVFKWVLHQKNVSSLQAWLQPENTLSDPWCAHHCLWRCSRSDIDKSSDHRQSIRSISITFFEKQGIPWCEYSNQVRWASAAQVVPGLYPTCRLGFPPFIYKFKSILSHISACLNF